MTSLACAWRVFFTFHWWIEHDNWFIFYSHQNINACLMQTIGVFLRNFGPIRTRRFRSFSALHRHTADVNSRSNADTFQIYFFRNVYINYVRIDSVRPAAWWECDKMNVYRMKKKWKTIRSRCKLGLLWYGATTTPNLHSTQIATHFRFGREFVSTFYSSAPNSSNCFVRLAGHSACFASSIFCVLEDFPLRQQQHFIIFIRQPNRTVDPIAV